MKRPGPRPNNQSSGFTLIEVLVVVIIAAILGGIAAPSWLAYLNRQRVGAVKSDVIQTLKQAQQDAIQRRQSVTVEFFTPTNLPPGGENVPTVSVGGTILPLGGGNIRPGLIQLEPFSVQGGVKKVDRNITFDYQGVPLIQESTTVQQELPFVVSISATGSSAKQCVIVANLLGSLKTAQGADCDNPKVDPATP